MRKQDHLSTLIDSLSKNEKRYFKLQASLHSGDKTFTHLFDELAKSNVYEPEKLIKKLKISKPHLAHVKGYLEKVLLNSLRLYEQENDLKIWLSHQWQVAQILFNRKQFELSFSINEKALEKALAYENFVMSYSFLGLKYFLLMFLNRDEEAAKVIKQRALSLSQLGEVDQISNINIRFNNLARGGRDTETILRKIGQKAIFKTAPEKLKSNTARIRWHEMQQNYYCYVKHDFKTAIHHNLCKLHIFEAHPQLVYTWPYAYLAAYLYLGSLNGALGNAEEALKFAHEMELEADGHRTDIPDNMCNHFNLVARAMQVQLLSHLDRYADSIKKAQEMEGGLDKLEPGYFVAAKLHHALSLFYTGRHDEALKICDTLQDPTLNVKKELLFCNRILLVMVHHALKNYSLLPHLINAATAWAKRHQVKAPGTNKLIYWLREFEKIKSGNASVFFKQLDKEVKKNAFKGYTADLGLKNWVRNNLAAK